MRKKKKLNMREKMRNIDLEYDDPIHESELRVIKDAVNDLQIAVKCIGDAIVKLGVRIEKIENRKRRN